MKIHTAVKHSIVSGNTLKIMAHGPQSSIIHICDHCRTQEVTHSWYFHSNLNVTAQRPFKFRTLYTTYACKLSIFSPFASCHPYWNTYSYRSFTSVTTSNPLIQLYSLIAFKFPLHQTIDKYFNFGIKHWWWRSYGCALMNASTMPNDISCTRESHEPYIFLVCCKFPFDYASIRLMMLRWLA